MTLPPPTASRRRRWRETAAAALRASFVVVSCLILLHRASSSSRFFADGAFVPPSSRSPHHSRRAGFAERLSRRCFARSAIAAFGTTGDDGDSEGEEERSAAERAKAKWARQLADARARKAKKPPQSEGNEERGGKDILLGGAAGIYAEEERLPVVAPSSSSSAEIPDEDEAEEGGGRRLSGAAGIVAEEERRPVRPAPPFELYDPPSGGGGENVLAGAAGIAAEEERLPVASSARATPMDEAGGAGGRELSGVAGIVAEEERLPVVAPLPPSGDARQRATVPEGLAVFAEGGTWQILASEPFGSPGATPPPVEEGWKNATESTAPPPPPPRSVGELRTNQGGALVPVNDDTIRATSAALSVTAGLALTGGNPMLTSLLVVLTDFLSKKDRSRSSGGGIPADLGDVVRSLSAKTIEAYNYLVELDDRFELKRRTGDVARSSLERSFDRDTIKRLDDALSKTSKLLRRIDEEYDPIGAGFLALGVLSDLLEGTLKKLREIDRVYELSARAEKSAEEVLDKVREERTKQERRGAYKRGDGTTKVVSTRSDAPEGFWDD